MKSWRALFGVAALLLAGLPSKSYADDKVKFSKAGLEIDGKTILPICGEFHYWRVDPKLWDDILGRMVKEGGLTMVASYIPWIIHEPNRGKFDFTGWSNPRANLEGFLQLIKKHGLYFFARSGPYCYGEIDGGGPTDYATIQGGRTEKFVELSGEWVKQISQIWKKYSIHNGGPLVFAQVDNEILPHKGKFGEYLKGKYGSVQELNDRWKSSFGDLDAAALDERAYEGKISWRNHLDAMDYQLRYFPRWYLSTLRKMFEKEGVDVPLMSNNTFFSCQDWYTLQEESAFTGIDYYGYYLMPGDSYYWDYLYLSLNNNINKFPFSPEFQCGSSMMLFGPTPSEHQKLVTFFALASGMRGMNYYMYVERERWEGYCPVTENGKARPEWFAHKHFFKVLNDIEWVKLRRQCSVGVLWSMEQFWRFLYEGGRKYNVQFDDYTEVASRTYECAQQPLWAYVKSLVKSDTNFDMVDVRTDFSAYPVLVYAGPPILDRGQQDKLLEYVRGGGRLVFLSAPPDKEYDETPASVLIEQAGLQKGSRADKKTGISINGRERETYVFATFPEAADAEIVAKTAEGEACAVKKQVGKGEIIQVGFAALDEDLLRETSQLLALPLYVQGDNPWIQTSLHRSADGEIAVVMAINRNTQPERTTIRIYTPLEMGEDVWIEEEFNHTKLELAKDQSFSITVPAKDVAVIHIRKHKKAEEKADQDEEMRKLFKGVGYSGGDGQK